MNVRVTFPKEYKNWKAIIHCVESFLKSVGYTAFISPGIVEEIETDPELPIHIYNEMITKLAIEV